MSQIILEMMCYIGDGRKDPWGSGCDEWHGWQQRKPMTASRVAKGGAGSFDSTMQCACRYACAVHGPEGTRWLRPRLRLRCKQFFAGGGAKANCLAQQSVYTISVNISRVPCST
jgi:hypothetical protein